MPAASEDAHGMFVTLEPTLGAPVEAQISFQLNLVLRPDPAFVPLANLTAPVTVLPVFWAQEGFETLGQEGVATLKAALAAPTAGACSVLALALVSGLVLVAAGLLGCRQAPPAAGGRRTAGLPVVAYDMVPMTEKATVSAVTVFQSSLPPAS